MLLARVFGRCADLQLCKMAPPYDFAFKTNHYHNHSHNMLWKYACKQIAFISTISWGEEGWYIPFFLNDGRPHLPWIPLSLRLHITDSLPVINLAAMVPTVTVGYIEQIAYQ